MPGDGFALRCQDEGRDPGPAGACVLTNRSRGSRRGAGSFGMP